MQASLSRSSKAATAASTAAGGARYVVHERIARGGMGAVYRAHDRMSGAEVALKRVFMSAPQTASMYVASFEREYRVLASLDHPHIVRAFDYGVDAEGPFYTMELVAGSDLRIKAPLPWVNVCRMMRDLASALALLHARNLLHRDLSPSNVKIREDGHCVLLDFGALASFGHNQVLVGTPPFVPPESVYGAALDGRSDLFALGALAYWALTGKHAFPARSLDELEGCWAVVPAPPSTLNPEIPHALDELVLSLLNLDPLARPASAAQVISRSTALAGLPPDASVERRRIAQSFLIEPPFVGRAEQLQLLRSRLNAARAGTGAAVRVEAIAGGGRTRLLAEVALHAQLLGVTALRIDASAHAGHQGTARALALRLLDALPDVARERAKRFATMLSALGREVEERLNIRPSRPPLQDAEPANDTGLQLSDWLVAVAREAPLLIAIDNVEVCDAHSLGMLATIASQLAATPILLLISERLRGDSAPNKALELLRAHSETLPLPALLPEETHALARSLFGDAPNTERFADWLHERTAGNPLHAVEVSRQLIAKDVILYQAGFWQLPAGRPQLELPDALEDALSIRLAKLSPDGLALAQLLSLHRGEPSLDLCTRLCTATLERSAAQQALSLLDELSRHEVLSNDASGYRFVSSALREALLAQTSDTQRRRAHAKLGEVYEHAPAPEQRIDAGWHFMQCGEAVRGAELVAQQLSSPYRFLESGYRFGPAAEAALTIFKRHRLNRYRRVPLLGALALASFFESYTYALRYGDDVLDLVEDVSGLRAARTFSRFFGRRIGLVLGLLSAQLRFWLTPRSERVGSFRDLMTQSLAGVIAMVGMTSAALDADRAERIAAVLEPFALMPHRTTPRVIYECCEAIRQIPREHQPQVFTRFDEMLKLLGDPRNFPLLTRDGRKLLTASLHYGRGAFAIFRANGKLARESIELLENSDFKMFSMIGRQLRALYHANRGEIELATRYSADVELLASQLGSSWQVELWERTALLPVHLSTDDVVALSRSVLRLRELQRIAPSLTYYLDLATVALALVHHEGVEFRVEFMLAEACEHIEARAPRSSIGWTTAYAYLAAASTRLGRPEQARAMCERALALTSDADREYVTLFLALDLQAAFADSALGDHERAAQRIDVLLERFATVDHPLARGLLHEARARISHAAGDMKSYSLHLSEMSLLLRPLRNPVLIAKCERVAALAQRDHDNTKEQPQRSSTKPR